MKIEGSCLCQAVKYQLTDGEFFPISNCHCNNCRKAQSAAFGTYLPIRKGDFSWVQGEELVSSFESSAKTYRCFCSVCGSQLVAFDDKEIRCLAMGSIDGDPGLRPESHIYVSQKAPWYEITDSLPQFELRGPDTKPPVVVE